MERGSPPTEVRVSAACPDRGRVYAMINESGRKNAELIQINLRIQRLEGELRRAYADRAGRVMLDDHDLPTAEAWCVFCGRHLVDVRGGLDTCDACLEFGSWESLLHSRKSQAANCGQDVEGRNHDRRRCGG